MRTLAWLGLAFAAMRDAWEGMNDLEMVLSDWNPSNWTKWFQHGARLPPSSGVAAGSEGYAHAAGPQGLWEALVANMFFVSWLLPISTSRMSRFNICRGAMVLRFSRKC